MINPLFITHRVAGIFKARGNKNAIGMLRRCCIGVGLMMLSHGAAGVDLSHLILNTANYPPANFEKNGEISGYAVDLLFAAAKQAGSPLNKQQLNLQPWARSYRETVTNSNALLFATTRTAHREKLFHWIGPIHDIKVVVLARKDAHIEVNKPIDMAKYRIGVIRDDVGEQSLLALGLPRESLQEATSIRILAQQLHKKRIDLLAYDQSVALWWANKIGLNADDFEAVYTLKSGELYFAANKQMSPEVVDALQRGLDALKATQVEPGVSVYQQIIDRYWQ